MFIVLMFLKWPTAQRAAREKELLGREGCRILTKLPAYSVISVVSVVDVSTISAIEAVSSKFQIRIVYSEYDIIHTSTCTLN